MFLRAEKLAQPRSATYSEMGSAEHLFALINLCELIERHKKFILKRAQSSGHKESKIPQCGTEGSDAEFGRRLSLQNVIGRTGYRPPGFWTSCGRYARTNRSEI